MKQRSRAKASKSSAGHSNRNHRSRRRNQIEVNVKPVAMQTGDSGEAMIPAVIKSSPDSTDAVISVEVKRGNSTRRRAAVIPIAVRKRGRRVEQRPQKEQDVSARNQNRWSDPITDSVVSISQMVEGAVHLVHDFGFAAVNMAELLTKAIFARVTVVASAAEQGQLDEIDLGTVIRDPRRAEVELRAA